MPSSNLDIWGCDSPLTLASAAWVSPDISLAITIASELTALCSRGLGWRLIVCAFSSYAFSSLFCSVSSLIALLLLQIRKGLRLLQKRVRPFNFIAIWQR